MKRRYRLKLTTPPVGGVVGQFLRLFPNALTFVGYPSEAQLMLVASASAVLSAFGVGIAVEET